MKTVGWMVVGGIALLLSFNLFAHGVDDSSRAFLQHNQGVQFFPFYILGRNTW